MSFLSKIFTALGLVLLVHSGYSAYEHASLYSHLQHGSISAASAVPLDIKVETIVAVIILSFAIVLGAEPLRPISWSVWAGKIEKAGGHANPFKALEERPGLVDIRAKRKEFADWVRERDTIVKS